MALHALAYCERLFYLEEVEEIRVADERVYAGRALHEELAREEATETRTFEMESDSLGLKGKIDAIRRRDGAWAPYEHKRGRCARGPDKQPEAWNSDALQVSAYGMLIEEALQCEVNEGRVHYHADNVTVRVPLDLTARQSVRDAIARARILREQTTRPPITSNERLCIKCSLAPVCLPEEERLAENADWETVRLFPPRPEGQVLHLTTPGARIGRSGDTLVVTRENDEKTTIPIHDVEAVIIHGNAQMTTQALHLCAAHGVPLHWLTGGGVYVGALASGAGGVQRRIRQFQALNVPETCLDLARRLCHAKVESQLRYLLRATRSEQRPREVEEALTQMRHALSAIESTTDADALRGHEGNAGRAWFQTLPMLISPDAPPAMKPNGRSRRPPRDRFNAALSFGYALLYRSVLQAVLAVGLEPAFGFYHRPRSAAYPLVLDLMELFRVPLWDIPLIGSTNRRQWDTVKDFHVSKTKVWLSDSGRAKAIDLYERRLSENWKHPVLDYSLSYARTLELEVRLLEKEWTGKPGLFARARLR